MEIYQELVFMFGRALDVEISNLNFSNFGGLTKLLRVYEKGNDNSILTINLGRMRTTRNSPRSMALSEQVKDLLRDFMETEYFKNKISQPEKYQELTKIQAENSSYLVDTLAQTVQAQARTIERLEEINGILSGFIQIKGLSAEYDALLRGE